MPHKNKPRGKRHGSTLNGRSRWNQSSNSDSPSSSNSPFATVPAPGRSAQSAIHTLIEEARNTSKRPRGLFDQDGKLRHRPVVFISAGLMDPLKEFEVEKAKPQRAVGQPVQVKHQVEEHSIPAVIAELSLDSTAEDTSAIPVTGTPQEDISVTCPAPKLFVVDTMGDKSLRPKRLESLPMTSREESDHDTDSSEEVILFRGRDAALRSRAQSQRASLKPAKLEDTMQLRDIDVQIKVVEKTITANTTHRRHAVDEELATQEAEQFFDKTGLAPAPAAENSGQISHLDILLNETQSDEDAALIADYIANIDGDGEVDEDDEEEDTHPGLGSHAFHILRDLGGSDSDAIREPSTADDSEQHVLEEDDEAGENDDDDDNYEDGQADLSAALRRKMEAEDEQIARILAKQEELGLGGDALMLYDDVDDDGHGDWELAPKVTPKRKKKGSTKQAKIIQKKGQYPSATAMADAFDDLDLMDWHRAALNNFEQAAKRATKPPLHDDSELEEAMNIAFQKDRLRKAEKKKQREALRAQGLLGKKINPDDLRIKYPVGMSKDELVFELEQFVLGENEQLIFPPLDKHARKCLHTVASHLKIKSQSSGSGDNRHPVLFRTGRTLAYEERMFESTVNRIIRRPYFTRVDVDTDVAKAARAGPRKDTGSLKRKDNAVSYREGEIVGQHAREITSDNKGRVLLEKMGWSKGMALGTMDNKGIMVPIAHVMKKSKLGLGDI